MLQADLTFNAVMLLGDILSISLAVVVTSRKNSLRGLGSASLLFAAWSVLSAWMLTGTFSLRLFGTMRFAGMAAFWHFPLVLGVWAYIHREKALSRNLAAAGGLLILLLYAYAYHVEPHRLEITRYDYTHSRLEGLERPVVIAQISDLQAERVGAYEARVLREIAHLKPDMIVHTGDYLHTSHAEEYKKQAARLHKLLSESKLRPPLGSYAVKGDCDHHHLWKDIFSGEPVTVLEDATAQVDLPGVSVNLVGLAPEASRAMRPAELRAARRGRAKQRLDIYVGHSPDFVEALASEDEPFLALAGHTHGGQVQIPLFGPLLTLSRLPRKYADAYLPYGSGVLSVSRGLGMERHDAPRLRFLCRPEIRLITLRPFQPESP